MSSTKTFSLSELAPLIDAELKGDPNCQIHGISTLENAKPGHASFMHSPRYREQLIHTKASVVILPVKFADACITNALIAKNPLWSYAKLAKLFQKKLEQIRGIHPTAIIGDHCNIHPNASIGAYCVIGDHVEINDQSIIHSATTVGSHCSIGKQTQLDSRVTLYSDVKIGDHCIISSGAVIGANGFGNVQNKGQWFSIPQLGGVTIGNRVEIGANTTIDCGSIEDTIIEDGVKLDNQVLVAHNVRIGENTVIAGSFVIAGSVTIGKNCMIGGAGSLTGHITIADGTVICGASNIGKSIEKPDIYLGAFQSMPQTKWLKNMMRFNKLDEISKRLFKLEKKITEE